MKALMQKLEQGWRKLAGLLDTRELAEKKLLEALQHNYLEEQQIREVLERESGRVPYAHLRQKLLEVAAREKRHAELLAAKIQELGGHLPPRVEALQRERRDHRYESTLDLLTLLQEEKDECVEYLQTAHLAREAGKSELHALLRQIAEEERQHRRELIDIVTRLNPLPESDSSEVRPS